MEKVQFFKGEPVQPGSSFTSEAEAVYNAGFGAYNYDPAARLNMQQQPNPVYLPGWQGYSTSRSNDTFGYNPNMMPQQPYYYGQPVGLGSNPYYNGYGSMMYGQQPQPMYYGNQFYNPNSPNPALQGFGFQAPPQQQTLVSHIPAYNLGGEFLPLPGYEEKIEQLKAEFWEKEQEQLLKNSSNGYNNMMGYNYYGSPYVNQYGYNSLRAEAGKIIQQMQDEARENRRLFNIKLSKIMHSYLGHNYDEEKIEELYTGRDIENPGGITYQELFTQNRFANLVPFDNSNMYAARAYEIQQETSAIIRPDCNMKEFFDNAGILRAKYAMEEEMHRRKNISVLYDSSDSGYKYYVKKKVAERYAAKNGTPAPVSDPNRSSEITKIDIMKAGLAQFPTLSGATVSNDGTINVTCNFGSMKGSVYSVNNQNEAEYDQKRERFMQFKDSIVKSIYPSSGGS